MNRFTVIVLLILRLMCEAYRLYSLLCFPSPIADHAKMLFTDLKSSFSGTTVGTDAMAGYVSRVFFMLLLM